MRNHQAKKRAAAGGTIERAGEAMDFGPDFRVIDGGGFPLMLQPLRPDIPLALWATEYADQLRACIHRYGAILIRQAAAEGPEQFVTFAESICPALHTEYGDLGDDELTGKTYAATPYPLELPIHFHNESACNNSWPLLLFFYCHQQAEEGGASRLVDSRRVLSELPTDFRERLSNMPLTYTRTHYPHLDTSWQRVYGTSDPSEAEKHCIEAGMRFEWKSGTTLQTQCDRQASVQHPVSNEDLLFHQLFLFHPAGLEDETRRSLGAVYGESEFPRSISFMDGETITDDTYRKLYDLYEAHSVDVVLQRGDILVIDNMIVAHGRAPFRGARKILVAMGNMIKAAQPANGAARETHLPHPDSMLSQAICRSSYPSVIDLFAQHAATFPDAVAVRHGAECWSYGRTLAFAQHVASRISSKGILRGQTVAVIGDSSFELVAAMLGVWMMGGVILPLDSSTPAERLRSQLAASGCRMILSTGAMPSAAEDIQFLSLLALVAAVTHDPGLHDPGLHNPGPAALGPDDAAYIFFTSGTTGAPKGILGLHGGLSHFLSWQRTEFDISPSDRFAQLTNLSFDVMLRDIFLPLISGATLCLPPNRLELANPWAWIQRERITVLHVVPSVLSRWLAVQTLPGAEFRSLRLVFSAGEPLTDSLIRRFRQRISSACALINLYGPTETTLAKCWYRIPDEPQAGVQPIGTPLPETQVLILDGHGNTCAEGATGEIVIRTPHRTAGYLAPDPSSVSAFRRNLHHNDAADLLFHTGDAGRIGSDGMLHIAGRMDDQLKILGVRVSPQEIVAALLRHPGISQAHVLGAGREVVRLVAFIVASEREASRDSIITLLQAHLPVSMIPHRFIYLDSIPTTERGKADREKLHALAAAELAASPVATSPQTQTERELATLWSTLLGCDAPTASDNFLFLGGHSLLAMQLVSRVREQWESDFTVQDVFENLSLRDMAARIDQTSGQGKSASNPLLQRPDRSQRFPLSSSQRRLWFLSQLEPESGYYNIPGAIRFRGPIDLHLLRSCTDQMLRRHEPLRTRFESNSGEPWQVVEPAGALSIRRLDLRHMEAEQRRVECQTAARNDALKPFDLTAPPLVRLLLVDLDENDAVLVYTFSHLIADGWSNVIFVRELSSLYAASIEGSNRRLPAPSIQYADYAIWEQTHSAGHSHASLEYWKTTLGGAPERLILAGEKARPPVQKHSTAECSLTISEELTRQLHRFCRDHDVTLFIAVLTLFKVVLHQASGERDICIGTPVANRPLEALNNSFGCFINTLVIRSQIPVECNFTDYLQIVRRSAVGAFTHQQTPFDQVVAGVRPIRSPGHHPLFQVLVNMLHWEQVPVALPQLTAEREWLVSPQTKFDMTLYVRQHDAVIDFHLVYDANLFDASRMEDLLKGFHATIQQCLDAPDSFRVDSPTALNTRTVEPAPGTGDADLPPKLQKPVSKRHWTKTELGLAHIWREVLGVDEIARDDDFFELGGYSLLATRLVARIAEHMQITVPVWKLFEFPTITALAEYIDARNLPQADAEVAREASSLLPAQQRIWKLHAEGKDGHHFNVPRAVRMQGRLQLEQLRKALNAVVAQHEALRTCFSEEGDRVIQRVLPAADVPIQLLDLAKFDDPDQRHREELACIQSEARHRFDLRNEIPLRVTVLRLSDTEHILLVTTHHIAADCWSMGLPFQTLIDEDDPWHYGVFFRDLMHFYDHLAGTGADTGAGTSLPVVKDDTLRIADIFAMRSESESMQDFPVALRFWQRYLQGASQVIRLPADHAMPVDDPMNGKRVAFAVRNHWHSRLQQFCHAHQTTNFVTLFAAFARSIRNWSGASDFLVGLPVSNRGTPDSEGLIGHIGNTIVLRARFPEVESLGQFVRRLHQEIHAALAYQYYPFEELVHHIGEPSGCTTTPLFQVRFVFQNIPVGSSQPSSLVLSPIQFDRGVSKYDLSLVIAAQGSKLRGWCEYKSPLFEQSTIDGFVGKFLDELGQMLETNSATHFSGPEPSRQPGMK